MFKRSIRGAAVLAVAWIAAPTTAFAAASIANGSFESGTYDRPQPWNTFFAGATNVTGWTIDAGSVDATFQEYWPASDGTVSIDLNGQGPGTISQAIATTVGTSYVVAFDLSGNPACGNGTKTLTVSATGTAPETMSFDTGAAGASLADMKWSARDYAFVATSTTTTLAFASTTGGTPCGPAVDNVRISEPAPPVSTVPTTAAECKDGGWETLTDTDGATFKNQGDCVSFVASDGRNVAATSPARDPAAARSTTAASTTLKIQVSAAKHGAESAGSGHHDLQEQEKTPSAHH